jgi:hypothetical protein
LGAKAGRSFGDDDWGSVCSHTDPQWMIGCRHVAIDGTAQSSLGYRAFRFAGRG